MEGTKGSMKQVLDLEGERMEREIACFSEKENSALSFDKKNVTTMRGSIRVRQVSNNIFI